MKLAVRFKFEKMQFAEVPNHPPYKYVRKVHPSLQRISAWISSLGASVAQLRIVVLGEQHAHTIAEICECWNGGHLGATTTPGYAAEVQAHYAAGLPETGTAVTA